MSGIDPIYTEKGWKSATCFVHYLHYKLSDRHLAFLALAHLDHSLLLFSFKKLSWNLNFICLFGERVSCIQGWFLSCCGT